MPEQRPAPQLDNVDLEREDFKSALQSLTDAYALTLVNRTFTQYETYRQNSHDVRWNTNDALYFGWVPQKTWPGTTIARSALSMPIVFDQIEASLPAIYQAIFGSQPEWFQVQAEAGVDPQEARQQQEKLLYDLDHSHDGFGLTARIDIMLAAKSALTYGNGGVAIEWDGEKKGCVVSWVDVRDIYVDPGASLSSVDHARSVIRRSHRTVEEVQAWRGAEGMNIPVDPILWSMANSRPAAYADKAKQVQSALLGQNYTPGVHDFLPNPSDRKIEVLTYYSKTRIIIVLNREWVAFSDKNPYGFIPFCFAPAYTVLGKFYAQSIPDVQEGNQRYIEGLLNGRIDEVTLALHPPRVSKANSLMTPSQAKWGPGSVAKTQNPKDDVQFFQPSGATTNVYSEIDFINTAAEKRTGISGLSTGVPRPSNANRTQGGMQLQLQGSSLRLSAFVANLEDYLIVPMLYKMAKMHEVHLAAEDPSTQLPGMNPEGELTQVPATAFYKRCRFKVLASSQMITREKLAQIFPFLLQTLVQGGLLQNLTQSGMTVDWNQMFQMLQDASGIGKLYTIVRPMTPQEQQMLAQQQQQANAAQQAQAQLDAQVRLQMGQMKAQSEEKKVQADLQKEVIKKQPTEGEMQSEALKFQLEQMKAQFDMKMKEMDLAFKEREMQLKIREKEVDHQLKLRQAQTDAILSQQKSEMDMAMQQRQASFDHERMEKEHEVGLQMTEEKANMARKQMEATAQMKMKLGGAGKKEEKPTGKKAKEE